jgi:hypothetical protein
MEGKNRFELEESREARGEVIREATSVRRKLFLSGTACNVGSRTQNSPDHQ